MISASIISGGFLRIGKLLLLCFTVLALTARAFGFCLEPQPTVACEFLDSDVVFIGTVVSARTVPEQDPNFLDGFIYSLSIQQTFRGIDTAGIDVFSENSSGRFPLKVGERYLLFVTKRLGRYQADYCGNSVPLSEAHQTIRELKRLRIPKDAEIEGRISFSGIPDTGPHVSGVHVVIRGERTSYTTISDRDGWFHLHVPSGKYSANVQPIAHWNVSPFDLSFDNPEHFVASKGHCSGLQFIASPT